MAIRRRILRYLRRLLYGLVAVIVLVAATVFILAHNLDSHLIRQKLRNLVQEQAGLTLDYRSASVQILHGLTLGDVTIEQPEPYRAAAPLLFSAKQVSLGWAFLGKGSLLRKIKAEDIEVTLVTDEAGRSSLDAIGSGQPAKPRGEPVPPGRMLGDTISGLPGFDHITLARVGVILLRTEHGRVVERTRLSGFGCRIVSSGEDASRSITIDVGRERDPVTLALAMDAHEALAKLWLQVAADAAGAKVRVRLGVDRQNLTPALASRVDLLALDAQAKSDRDRLAISLDRLDAVDHAVAAHGKVALGATGASLDEAAGTIDLGRLAKLVPSRPALRLGLARGNLKWSVAGLALGPVPQLDAKGRIEISANLADARFEQPGLSAELGRLEWTLDVRPHAGGAQAKLTLPLEKIRVVAGESHAEWASLHVTADALLGAHAHGKLSVRAGALSLRDASGSTEVGGAETQLDVTDVRLDGRSAVVALDGKVASLANTAGKQSVRADDVAWRLRSHVEGGLPKSINLELPIGRLELAGFAQKLPPGPARLMVALTGLHIDESRPLASHGDLLAELSGLGVQLSAKGRKRTDAADFQVKLAAPHLGALASLAPADLALPGKMGIAFEAAGHVEQLSAAIPRGHATVHAHLDDPAVTLSDSVFGAKSFDLDVDAKSGGHRAFDVRLKVAPQAATVDDDRFGNGVLAVHAAYDPAIPTARLEIDGSGDEAPRVKLAFDAKWDRARRSLAYSLDGKLGHLAMLATFLPDSLSDDHWIDLSDLEIGVTARGDWAGLVTGFDRRGAPRLAADPKRAQGDGALELALRHVKYVDAAGVDVTIPSVAVKTRIQADAKSHVTATELDLPHATVVTGGHTIQIDRLADHGETRVQGDPLSGPITASNTLTIGKVDQGFVPAYRIADATIALRAARSADGALRLDALDIDNRGGGTHLKLDGALVLPRTTLLPGPLAADAPLGFHSTEVRLALEQKLDRMSGAPSELRGQGTVSVKASVASGDLHRFHVAATARFDGASLELPAKKIAIARIDGELPVVEDLLVLGGSARLLPAKEDSNAYPSLRFVDQHSFLSDRGALRIERIAVGDILVDELAGNLRIRRDLIAIDQLEARLYGGHIAGQCLITARGADSKITLHARATGIQAGSDKERFDGNAALTLAVGERAVDGRVEIVRIGKKHLLSLLDELDPHHSDPGSNRIRTALSLGYPDRVRLLFERGFASLHVELSGLASIVSLTDVTGIPVGPLAERYLGPALSSEATP